MAENGKQDGGCLDGDDNVRRNGNDSDNTSSVGNDLYEDEDDKELLEKMSQLDRDMILAERSSRIDDYKLKQMARKKMENAAIRKDISPPSLCSRMPSSTRTVRASSATKNADENDVGRRSGDDSDNTSSVGNDLYEDEDDKELLEKMFQLDREMILVERSSQIDDYKLKQMARKKMENAATRKDISPRSLCSRMPSSTRTVRASSATKNADEDDVGRRSGDDSDNTSSVGNDLYEDEDDKELLEKMFQLDREMILAERSSQIDDYKLKQMARKKMENAAIRKDISPRSLCSRMPSSTRTVRASSATKNAGEDDVGRRSGDDSDNTSSVGNDLLEDEDDKELLEKMFQLDREMILAERRSRIDDYKLKQMGRTKMENAAIRKDISPPSLSSRMPSLTRTVRASSATKNANEDDVGRRSGDDSDNTSSVGNDLYEDEDDKELLEKMFQLDREMILAKRSSRIDDYKLKQMVRKRKNATIRKDSSSPSLHSRTRSSTRTDRGSATKNVDEDDVRRRSGDDSDIAPSLGSDLYEDEDDKEQLEKMFELDREMILAERSSRIDDYKLKEMSRKRKNATIRKDNSSPPLSSRTRSSTRTDRRSATKNVDEDDIRRHSGDDSDIVPSVGSDLYEDEDDKELLEKMSELDREMILVERSNPIDDYKLKQMARKKTENAAIRKDSSSPPLPSRMRSSTRTDKGSATKNADEDDVRRRSIDDSESASSVGSDLYKDEDY